MKKAIVLISLASVILHEMYWYDGKSSIVGFVALVCLMMFCFCQLGKRHYGEETEICPHCHQLMRKRE